MRRGEELYAKALPTVLLSGFEYFLLHLIEARMLVLRTSKYHEMNQMSESSESTTSIGTKIEHGRARYQRSLAAANKYLDRPREELIHSITANNSSIVSLGPVGPQYIVTMALGNVQGGALCNKEMEMK